MADQPTPTSSSLEEARLILFEAAAYGGPLGEQVDRLVAAARAEVIREVEAYWRAYDERLQSPAAWDRLRTAEARLRALSQGGEV